MPDMVFFIGIGFLFCGLLVLMGEAAVYYMNRSGLYSQECYDKAFREIMKREKQLHKQMERIERLSETADGSH
jgi:hypothetical protein